MHNELESVTSGHSRPTPLSWDILIRKTTLAHPFLRSVMRVSPQKLRNLTHFVAPRPLSIHNGDTIKGSSRTNMLKLSCLADSESAATPILWTDSLIGAHAHTERSARTQTQTAYHKRGLEDNLLAPSAVGAQWVSIERAWRHITTVGAVCLRRS